MIENVRWLRVVGAALLVEIGLMATLPLVPVLGEQTVFNVVVPLACLVIPFVVAFIATRTLPSARVLNAVLIGVVATAMYFALVIGVSSIQEASASYGMPLFFGVNALRVASATAGGYAAARRVTRARVA